MSLKKLRLKKDKIAPKYLHLFERNYCPKEYNIYYGSSGSGKSFHLALYFVWTAIQNPKFGLWVVRKTRTSMTKTVIPQFLDPRYGALAYFKLKDRKSGDADWDYSYNKTDGILLFRNGAVITFTGYDNPESVKGLAGIWGVWMEEATDFSKSDLGLIGDRLREFMPEGCPWGNSQKIFMSFNPVHIDHWIRDYFFKEEIDKTDEVWNDILKSELLEHVFKLKTTWRDNPWYNGKFKHKYARDHARKTNKRLYDVYCNGNWGVLGDLIYENVTIVTQEQFDNANIKRISYGCDFGFAHVTAMCKLGLDENEDLWISNEVYEPKMTSSEICSKYKEKYNNPYEVVYCDCARPEIIDEMVNSGINAQSCKKGAGSVLDGIEWMQDRHIYVVEDCTGAINEFNKYTWAIEKSTGKRLAKPIKIDDDAMDAIRYGTQGFKEGNWAFA